MQIFTLPNLRSDKTGRVEIQPGDMPDTPPLPRFADKAAYRAWCEDEKTDHVFISCVEALTPGVRVSKSNPPWRIHGLVAEYDAPPGDNWQEHVVKHAPVCPTWMCKTYSGNVRLIWAFEQAVSHVNERFTEAFYKAAFAELKTKRLLPGWEPDESSDTHRYFELGREWSSPGKTIPTHRVEAWLHTACQKTNWKKEGGTVPFEKLREEGEKQFPGRWPGGWEKFDVGARGVRFWEPGADALSVIAVETGCVCFTGDKGFVSWAEIFGGDFVRKSSGETIGKAIENIFFCPPAAKYFTETKVAGLQPWGKEDIRLRLMAGGLSPAVARGQVLSEVDLALLTIQDLHTIDGVFPALYRDSRILEVNGMRFLNTSKVKLIQPMGDKLEWGQGFPWIAEFLQRLFLKQLPYYLHWLGHFYRSCLKHRPVRGLALFIAGPKNCGKTALNNAVHKQIFGAAGEATPYLTGQDQFNGQLFACPIWTVDDGVASGDSRTKNHFSQAVKAIAANDEFTMRSMFKEGVRMPWLGRLIVTMNDDPDSMQMLPSTEGNLLDKIMLLRAYPTFDEFPTDEAIGEELPAFCSWLRDMAKSPKIQTGGRFGVLPYHAPDLVQTAEDAQDSTSSKELILDWAGGFFEQNPKAESWEGNPTELLLALAADQDKRDLVYRLLPNAVWVGRNLNKLIARSEPWIRAVGPRKYQVLRQAVKNTKKITVVNGSWSTATS